MKLLFDENPSHTLAERWADIFRGSTHVRNVGLTSADDVAVWSFAVDSGFVLISKDADMHDRSLLFGFPPKVIWVRIGSCSTNESRGWCAAKQNSSHALSMTKSHRFSYSRN